MAGNRWTDKEWRSALRLALLEKHKEHGTKLRAIAEKVVELALDGELGAITEVGNRLDGKAAQNINVDQTITHELASLSDTELAGRIKAELASLAGRGEATPDTGKLH